MVRCRWRSGRACRDIGANDFPRLSSRSVVDNKFRLAYIILMLGMNIGVAASSVETKRNSHTREAILGWMIDAPRSEHDGCQRCASICESCGRSPAQRQGRVLCDGLCRECVEWDFVFDVEAGAWLMVDRHGECADCGRDGALFSVGDGLVCILCLRVVNEARVAA